MKEIHGVDMANTLGKGVSYVYQELLDIRSDLSDLLTLAHGDGCSGCTPYVEMPSPSQDPEVPIIYHFIGNTDAARAMVAIWAAQILVNAILIRVWNVATADGQMPQFDSSFESECEDEIHEKIDCIAKSVEWYEDYNPSIKVRVRARSSAAASFPSTSTSSRRTFDAFADIPVCMTILPSQTAGAMGAMFMGLPLAIAYRFALTWDRKAWLRKKIALFLGGSYATQYSLERMEWVVDMLAGASNGFQPSEPYV